MKGHTMFKRRSIALAMMTALGAAAAGCGGNGASPLPVGAPSAPAHGSNNVSLTILIPKAQPSARGQLSAGRLQPSYVSSSTQSLALTIKQNGVTALSKNVSLSVGSNPNCATVSGGIQCTIAIGLTSGSYTGTISTYDGPIVSGSPTGNLLSQGQSVPISVTAGQTDNIPVVLDGVPASITIVPASGSTIVGSTYGGFTLQSTAKAMTINAYDADGNVILGSGAPTYTAAATGGITVTQPTLGSPNQITLSGTSGQSGTLTVTAAAPNGGYSCSSSGVVCTATASLSTWPHHLFVANDSTLSVYTTSDDVNWSLVNTNSNGVSSPEGIAAGPDGTVFVANDPNFIGTPNVAVFPPPYTATPAADTSGISYPNDLKVTSGGTLLVADGSNIDKFVSPWTGTPTHISASVSRGIAIDSSGDAFGGNLYGPTILYSAPSYTSATTINSSFGESIAVAPDNTLFVGDYTTQAVYVYAPPYTGTPVKVNLPAEGGSTYMQPVSLTADSNGNLWVDAARSGSCPCYNYLLEFQKPFSGTETPTVAIPANFQNLQETITADASGDVIGAAGSSVLVINSSGTTTATITSGVSFAESVTYIRK